MGRWLDGIEEAAFAAVPGGYVFQSPNAWLFARPVYYLVNDAQKAAIGECLRKRVRFAMACGLLSLLVVLALVSGTIVFYRQPPLPPFVLSTLIASVMLVPLLIVPHIYLMRMLRPIIKDLPTTDQRFPISVQLSKSAGAMPQWVPYAGIVGGLLMVLGGMLGMYDWISDGRLAGRWISPAFSMTVGVFFAGYFLYLAKLKKNLGKSS